MGIMEPPETNEQIDDFKDSVDQNILDIKSNLSAMRHEKDDPVLKRKNFAKDMNELMAELVESLPEEEKEKTELQDAMDSVSKQLKIIQDTDPDNSSDSKKLDKSHET